MARTCTCGRFRFVNNQACLHGFCYTPSGAGLKGHKALLGSPRTPYAKWAAAFSPYTWALWRNWKPKPAVKVETGAEVRARQIRAEVGGYVVFKWDGTPIATVPAYTWPLWHERKPRKVPRDAMGHLL